MTKNISRRNKGKGHFAGIRNRSTGYERKAENIWVVTSPMVIISKRQFVVLR